MKYILALSFCFLFLGKIHAQGKRSATAKTRILFVLDASGSMLESWDKGNKLSSAKTILSKMIDSLAKIPNTEVGLRVFGSLSPLSANDCKDTKLEVPIRANNGSAILEKISALRARGITPIYYSLSQAAADFGSATNNANNRNIIVLVTDGIESCDGDVCEIARTLQKRNISLTPLIIGLGMSRSDLDKFNCMGRVFDANSNQSFKNSINTAFITLFNKTTTTINLLDAAGKPTVSNIPIVLYENQTNAVRYTFMHTLNGKNLPDTIYPDAIDKYTAIIYTTPPIVKTDINIIPDKHNNIDIPVLQGDITLKTTGTETSKTKALIKIAGTNETIETQTIGSTNKYLTGNYDIEVLTLPRIYFTNVAVTTNATKTIEIPAKGTVNFTLGKSEIITAQIFTVKKNELVFVSDITGGVPKTTIGLQPGLYKIVYKLKNDRKAQNTKELEFGVASGGTQTLGLY